MIRALFHREGAESECRRRPKDGEAVIPGGYTSLVNTLVAKIKAKGVKIQTGVAVRCLACVATRAARRIAAMLKYR